MRKASRKTSTARERRWRVSIIRKRGEYLGTVEAPDASAAELAAPVPLLTTNAHCRCLLGDPKQTASACFCCDPQHTLCLTIW
jgi:hypothetical protein